MTALLEVAPRYGTRRRDRATWATPRRLELLARVLGLRGGWLPWQRLVLEVAGEHDGTDDAPGRLCYPTVGVSVGRQEGKSSLTDGVALLRSAIARWQRGAYLCQDRSIAADRLLELGTGGAAPLVRELRRSNGKERITFANRSTWEIRAATGKAGRGSSLDTAMIDEAALLPFAVVDAIAPTQAARPDPQLWILSNAGDAGSLMFWHYTELGREHALADSGAGVAWFEWGALEEEDRADPATWAAAMPALGRTIAPAFVATKLAELERAPERFDREYLNRWPPGMGGTDGIDLAAWRRAARPELEAGPRPVLAFDVALDRSSSSIALAGRLGRLVVVEVVRRRAGTAWVAGEVAALRRELRCPLVVADTLTSASIVAELRAAHRVDVLELGSTDVARACSTFADRLEEQTLAHRAQVAVDDAAAVAVRRRFGDSWSWSRTRSAGDISPLMAAVLASWGLVASPAPAPRPAVAASH